MTHTFPALPALLRQPFAKSKWPAADGTPCLSRRLLADVLAALLVGLALAFLLAPMDLAMLRAGKPDSPGALVTLGHVFRDTFLRPDTVVPAVAWTWLLFAGTYGMANSTRSVCDELRWPPALYVWLFTTTVNCVIMCLKDAYLTGGNIVPPQAAVVAWVARDLVFSLVVFVIPEPLSKFLTSRGVKTIAGFQTQDAVQILLPLPLQLFTTPLHFLGVSLVASPQLPASFHLAAAFREFRLRVGIRCARVLVPYCFGAVANRKLRTYFSALLAQRAAIAAIATGSPRLIRWRRALLVLVLLAVMAQQGHCLIAIAMIFLVSLARAKPAPRSGFWNPFEAEL
mmetsp:Transcript_47505/g.112987  ORF Transcript_47505/g.112987 Transcript_47505/m.112987 type:complete len:341 (-) Transcript_47505:248-1270(-)